MAPNWPCQSFELSEATLRCGQARDFIVFYLVSFESIVEHEDAVEERPSFRVKTGSNWIGFARLLGSLDWRTRLAEAEAEAQVEAQADQMKVIRVGASEFAPVDALVGQVCWLAKLGSKPKYKNPFILLYHFAGFSIEFDIRFYLFKMAARKNGMKLVVVLLCACVCVQLADKSFLKSLAVEFFGRRKWRCISARVSVSVLASTCVRVRVRVFVFVCVRTELSSRRTSEQDTERRSQT